MDVHLVDGTFELFRCFHGAPRAASGGKEVGGARGFLATMVALLTDATHVAVAFDSVVAPPGRPGPGAESVIAHQAPLAAEAVRALGLTLWPTGRYQADEMLATAAARYADDPTVDRVVICSNDKDFHQCVRADRVVVLDRIRAVVTDEPAVRARYGVAPSQLPDLFALVGDPSDGLPGVPGWGVKSAAALLDRYGRLDLVPANPDHWEIELRGRDRLARALVDRWDETLLCRDLARLRTDLPLAATAADLAWQGPNWDRLEVLAEALGDRSAIDRLER